MIATANAHKVDEFKMMLEPLGYEVLSLLDMENPIDIEETGTTFEENALIKVRTLYEALHMPIISDDSGLAVNAMDGAPGVYSARFMGYDTPYQIKNQHIIDIVNKSDDRGAQYVCVIAYVDEIGNEYTFRGEVEGEIAHAQLGEHGFGYDPIFYYPPFHTTLANVDETKKNKISHRANALAKLIVFMEDK